MADLTPPPATPGEQIRDLIDKAHEDKSDDGFRAHLGASILGRECERELWYGFHWTTRSDFNGRMLRLFRRGHNEEPSFVEDLRAIGAEVMPENPDTGEQWRFSVLNGHVGGSCDGYARNIPGHGDLAFVTEYKTHGAKSFRRFFSAKLKDPESPVREVKPEHYAQMQLYMGWSGIPRALYGAVNKDNDEYYFEVVEFDEIVFGQLEAKAERVLSSAVPPARISDKPDFFKCKFCDHRETCHGEQVAAMNCRTCIASTVNLEGEPWTCSQGYGIPDEVQRTGCPEHRFIPDLIPFAKPVDADEEKRSIKYELIASDKPDEPTGEFFFNGSRDDGHYTSRELEALNPALILDDGLALLRDKFEGTIEGPERTEPKTFEFPDDDIPF